ncbi:hypothetical protein [Rhizobium sp. AN80A]|uniref:hypothetical protein n=1 Tax=Rhizobium sp. AN80A TaxID=3040673 RepID=UPI0024B35F25|nr:hypothetical protein [Rhizobium sp. AN80A]
MNLTELFQLSPAFASAAASVVCIYVILHSLDSIGRLLSPEKGSLPAMVSAVLRWLEKELRPVGQPSRRSRLVFMFTSAVMFYVLSVIVFISGNAVLLTAYLHSRDEGVFPLQMLCVAFFAFCIVVARLLLVNGGHDWRAFRDLLRGRGVR